MASELDVLLDKVDDPVLRADLRRQIALLRAKRRFGLVFEEHLPERVQLPEHAVRRGTKVVLRDDDGGEPRDVVKVARGKATLRTADGETQVCSVKDLVVVADFGEAIYPGLRQLGSLRAGGDKPGHVVIKGENYHVLEALQFTHAGKIDCVYIDPPYNTGARDWKYNNHYVDESDGYRHSKWLAFMQRRLELAKQLLSPDRSVLIVTIDAREQERLGLLLEQTFPGCPVQMASIVINPSGAGNDGINRVDEYAYFVSVGGLNIPSSNDDMLTEEDAPNSRIRGGLSWESFLRSGSSWYRSERPNLCYPIFVDRDSLRIVGAGAPFSGSDESERPTEVDGHFAAWPVRNDRRLGIWRTDAETLLRLVDKGYAYVSSFDAKRGTYAIKYLLSGTIALVESGKAPVERTGQRGQVVAATTSTIDKIAKSVWYRPRHNAGKHGSDLLQALVPGRQFPYPKSLYAVEDCLRLCVGDKRDAVILDFFAGSGTTAHAVMRLNRQDGGHRQSITVTNNEVSEAEARELRKSGHRPGDPEWEALGIFEHITRPRVTAAVTGVAANGEPVKGDYRFTDEYPMSDGLDENVDFFELTYLDPEDVEISAAFAGIAPLLWLRAGSRGEMIDNDAPYHAVTETYGVLFNPDHWRSFVSSLHDEVKTVFIVTDSPSVFAAITAELPGGVEAVRLYENYLSTFTLNVGQSTAVEAGAE